MADLLIARTTAVIKLGSRTVRIRRGVTVVAADDPAVAGREHLFRPLEVSRLAGPDRPARPARRGPRALEVATAPPGPGRGHVDTTPSGPGESDQASPGRSDDDPAGGGGESSGGDAEPSARDVRAWAREQDPPIEVPPRGKIPEDVVAAYKRAHGGAW